METTNILLTNTFPLCKAILEKQLDSLWKFTRSLAYYRAIHQDCSKIQSNKEFWVHIMNMCYLSAINDWSIVFGSDTNESHWKKLPQDQINDFKSEIRNVIFSVTCFTKVEWENYHKEIVDFRNGYVAHKNPAFFTNVPDLTKAFEISCAYFEKIKELLRPSKNEPEPLKVMFPKFQIEIVPVLLNDVRKNN